MDDYRFLEEIGRFVSEKSQLLQDGNAREKGKGRKTNENSANEPGWVRTAREAGVEVILLKEGMERRKANSSRFHAP